MEYINLVEIYRSLEKTTKRLEKTKIIADFLKKVKEEDIKKIIYLLQGRVFPKWDERELGISSQLTLKVIHQATGISIKEIEKLWKKTGDLGTTAEELIKQKIQRTLTQKTLTVDKIFTNLQKLPELTGSGTVYKKTSLLSELISHAKPEEAKFIIRTILGELRIGVAEGILRDAIAQSYNLDVSLIEKTSDLLMDYGEICLLARKGKKALQKITLVPGRPFKVMLAIRVETIEEAFKALGKPVQAEFKLDGFRVSIHHKDNQIQLFTRRMDNVTNQFKELIPIIKQNVKAKNYILDAELVGYNPRTKKYLPFQSISQRIKRKYDIEKIAKQFPVEINIFDIIYYNNKSLMQSTLKERRKILEKIIQQTPKKIVLTKKLVTDDPKKIEKFHIEALKKGMEGLMIKNINSPYVCGRRVGGWIKLKTTMENLDLVITGAQWGEGKRATWLSSFKLSCYDSKTKNFLEIGKVGTGIKEKAEGVTFKQLTNELKPYIKEKKGKTVTLLPKLVVEVAFEEIQKSPTYSSGMALRFPRIIRIRPEKSSKDVNTLEEIKTFFSKQKKISLHSK
jgi:DNA ligase-1